MSSTPPPSTSTPFESDATCTPFLVPSSLYLSTHPSLQPEVNCIATGALGFSPSSPSNEPVVLLLQRAPHDSCANLWEPPGGGTDSTDASILHAVVRELKEESGLSATRVGPWIGGHEFRFVTRSAGLVLKLHFFVEAVQEEVKIDENEHQRFVWASEEQVREGKCGEVDLKFTSQAQQDIVLEAFRIRKEMRESKTD